MNGRFSVLIMRLGIALGLFVHTTAGALGVAAIFQTSQYAFTGLKYAGAAYLIFLAWQAFTASKNKFGGDKTKSEMAVKPSLRGFTLCITLVVFGLMGIAAGSLGAWIKGSPTTQIWLTRFLVSSLYRWQTRVAERGVGLNLKVRN